MSINVSKVRKEELIKKIDLIRKHLLDNAPDSELESYLNDLSAELKFNKYGLVFEEHVEKIDNELLTKIPVFSENKNLEIDNGENLNFLIEGDNLPALTLLKKTHNEGIDFIYIDPPYNTKNKDFKYDDVYVDPDDEYKHSMWLSFMKKRLLLANSLLKKDGSIMISINEEELFELKMLCDEIFGPKNYLTTFSVKVRHEDRILKGDKDFQEVIEYMLMYRKSPEFKVVKKLVDNTSNEDYIYVINEKIDNPEIVDMGGKQVSIFKPGEYEIVKVDPDESNLKKINIRGSIKEGNSSGRFFMKHLNQFIGQKYGYLYKVADMGADNLGYRYFHIPTNKKRVNGDYYQGVPLERSDIKEVPYANYLDYEVAFNNVGYEGNVEFRNGKKPMDFLEKCFEMSGVALNKNSIVLDFFAGSGSTGHALMRLNKKDNGNRKFILVTNNENKICEEITYKRMKSAIEEDEFKESLKYYKVEMIDTENKVYYEYANELLNFTKELIQLENSIKFKEDSEFRVILTDEELDELINSNLQCKKIYLGYDILVEPYILEILDDRNIELVRIPNYYYSEMIRIPDYYCATAR